MATATSGAIVGALEGGNLQFLATFALTGPILGVAQWLVLRHYIPRPSAWIMATTLGWIVGQLIDIQLSSGTNALISFLWQTLGLWEVFWLNVIQQTLILAIQGCAQWLILRRSLQPIAIWILVSAFGGTLQGAVSAAVCAIACQPVMAAMGGAIATAITYSSGWLAYGIITGTFLALRLPERNHPQSR